jgi:dimethylargininase
MDPGNMGGMAREMAGTSGLALLRAVPASFARALAARPPDPPIDVGEARRQHAAYAEGLRWLGYQVEVLPADERHPDCPFIEDTSVIVGDVALITRPGAPSRQGEVEAVAEALGQVASLRLARMAAPATLDGGDVLLLGRRLYVGRTARTNQAGVAALAAAFVDLEIVPVALAGLLHRKCVCAPLSGGPAGRALVAEGALPPGVFGEAELVAVPAEEADAANVVARGDRVLMGAGYPRARRALEAAGLEVRTVDTSEFRKADGALTCLSLLSDLGPGVP